MPEPTDAEGLLEGLADADRVDFDSVEFGAILFRETDESLYLRDIQGTWIVREAIS